MPHPPTHPLTYPFTLTLGVLVGILLSQGRAIASDFPPPRTTGTCPTDLDTLMPLMLGDLPGYANRVVQRSRDRSRSEDISGYVLLASRPDLDDTPFVLSDPQFPASAEAPSNAPVRQVFFTTLERQYGISGFAQLQAHHRAFLTLTDQGWQLVLMRSSLQAYPGTRPPAPPRDNSHGIIAQAIRTWLRDCQAEAVDLSS